MAKEKKNKGGIESYKASSIVMDIVMLILGMVFMINTIGGKGDQVASIFVRVIGGILIAVGLIALIMFLVQKEKEVFDWVIASFGTAIGVFGAVIVIRPEPIISILNWIMGLIIIVYAIVVIFTSVGFLRPAGANYWGFSFVFGLIVLALGFFVIFFNLATKAMLIVIGISLILAAIGGIANSILALQAKKDAKRVIKAESSESSEPVKDVGSIDSDKAEDNEPSDGDVTRF